MTFRKFAGILFTVLFVLLLLDSIRIYIRFTEFRRLPTRNDAEFLLKTEWPQRIIARYFTFRSGGWSYFWTLRSFTYEEDALADYWWNRRILEMDVSNMSPDELSRYLPDYPLTLGKDLVPYLESALENGEYDLLWILDRCPGGDQVVRQWVLENILQPNDVDLLTTQWHNIIQSPSCYPVDLLSTYWRDITADDQETILDNSSNAMWTGRVPAPAMLKWLETGLQQQLIEWDRPSWRLIGSLAYVPDTKLGALRILRAMIAKTDAQTTLQVLDCLGSSSIVEVGEDAFRLAVSGDTKAALGILHKILHISEAEAVRLTKAVLSGPDSELRKGTIVLLCNHDSEIGERYKDDAYRGSAPRTILFNSIRRCVYGSKAVSMYEDIARHGYLETGKAWPPQTVDGPPYPDEMILWSTFIDSFPWFPGTDDAIYRMAYRQYTQGEYCRCLETIKDYYRRELADRDANPYICFLLQQIVQSDVQCMLDLEGLQELKALMTGPTLGRLIFEPEIHIDSLIKTLEWFLADQKRLNLVVLGKWGFEEMLDLAKLIGMTPVEGRFAEASKSYMPYYHSNDIAWILYRIPPMNEVRCINGGIDRREIRQASVDVRWVAAQLKNRVMRASETTVSSTERYGAIVWVIVHYFDTYIREAYKQEFAELFTVVSNIDTESLPVWLHEAHQTFVKRYGS